MNCQTFTIEKKLTFSKHRICWKENLKKCTNFEEQKGPRYIWGTFTLALLPSAVFRLQNRVF